MELGHDAGGARIELSREKIWSTTIALRKRGLKAPLRRSHALSTIR